eukprot:TRINITY_DN3060_c0_g1_i1.p1 TRINITY_DN3060_c0_g1~~TRINITY_DN3060_c0_g1_i1.p1  ORF type:complete len:139 (+),score=15.12 TRINITY_DN3060_c0_g1_i1:71-487(+)
MEPQPEWYFESVRASRKGEVDKVTSSMKKLTLRKFVKNIGKSETKTRKEVREEKKAITKNIQRMIDIEKNESEESEFSSLKLLLDTFTDEKHRSPFASKDDSCKPSSMLLLASMIGHKTPDINVLPPTAARRRRSRSC